MCYAHAALLCCIPMDHLCVSLHQIALYIALRCNSAKPVLERAIGSSLAQGCFLNPQQLARLAEPALTDASTRFSHWVEWNVSMIECMGFLKTTLTDMNLTTRDAPIDRL